MSEKSLLATTKTLLKSLVISSPENLTVDKLEKDYKLREGKEIPYQQLGYPNLKSFLYSIPDTLSVNPRTNIVIAIVPEGSSNAHVYKFVAEQKPSKNKRGRGHTNKSNYTNGFKDFHNRQQQQPRIWDDRPPMVTEYSQQNYYMKNQQTFQPFFNQTRTPGNLLAPPNTLHPNMAYANMLNNNSLLGPPPLLVNHSNFPLADLMSRRHFNGQSIYGNQNRKETVKKQSTPIPLNNAGHNGNTKLNGHADIKPQNEVAALPSIDDDDPILSIGNILMRRRSVPPATLPKSLKAGSIYQIFVTEITSMRHFFFQLSLTQHNMSDIEQQLSQENGDNIDTACMQVGDACAAFFAGQWLRAELITQPNDSGRLKLLFVDFGTIAYVPIENVRCLTMDLYEIPRLCHRGVLDFIEPLDDHKSEQKIIKAFCEMVRDKSLMAVISHVNNDDSTVVTLVDTSSPDGDLIINKMLMESARL